MTPLDQSLTSRSLSFISNIDKFVCDYRHMRDKGFRSCGTADDRSCWLRNPKTGEEFNITTDYEYRVPQGVKRVYHLDVTDGYVNANGLNFTEAKMFNNSWPGPLIEACWGDTVEIHVTNLLANNGTSCPIAPNSTFIYQWNATQYGSSWYHSHYSVQYADSLQAPITIHGQTSFPYDEAIEPISMNDWDILLSGFGNIARFTGGGIENTTEIPRGYEIWFDDIEPNPKTRAKRYLLRLVNTAFQSTFVFSIDNHNSTVVEADFVPIEPFNATSLLIAIGQRYHIIVEATPVVNSSNPDANPIPEDRSFWIRTHVPLNTTTNQTMEGGATVDANNCMKTGILRYDNSRPPSNGRVGEQFNVADLSNAANHNRPYSTAFFSFERPDSKNERPFQTTCGNPTFLNLDNVGDEWPTGWVVAPENYTADDWVSLIIHLHGHDFAIIQQEDDTLWDIKDFKPNKNKLNNPPRRDVVVLPRSGYAVIAFKSDNPGVWLMHCHIAKHASTGLSLQIMERQAEANIIWQPGNSMALDNAHKLYDKPDYPACANATNLQNDSGV
ncbi:multicopper oxidase-domain-containing protein [Colletotrichum phormii]|uniref:Multicopper oxidase-domain-containing protein n=1 Tax=Colletotrichum phormii TaxID=359342 RepID=A0AAJ0E8E2_9PEZI|nr:multicopper oxidase-domain-containing protein [Colletotrichum phormii]KAK1622754.1 multicopper oxidase-domain-containing protein [Colletotrichum phormii]